MYCLRFGYWNARRRLLQRQYINIDYRVNKPIYKQIVHVQYISANYEGKELGALDMLFDYLINTQYKEYDYFDFGQSTEQMGNFLNENLLFQKEGFGGRGVIYPVYEINIL